MSPVSNACVLTASMPVVSSLVVKVFSDMYGTASSAQQLCSDHPPVESYITRMLTPMIQAFYWVHTWEMCLDTTPKLGAKGYSCLMKLFMNRNCWKILGYASLPDTDCFAEAWTRNVDRRRCGNDIAANTLCVSCAVAASSCVGYWFKTVACSGCCERHAESSLSADAGLQSCPQLVI